MNQPDFTSCSSLLSPPLTTCLYLSPSNTPSFHCDGWMDERGRRGRRKPTPRGSGSPLPPPFFLPQSCNLTSPRALSHPPLAPSLPSLTIMSSPSLALPSRLALHRNGRKGREKGCDWPPSICRDSRIK